MDIVKVRKEFEEIFIKSQQEAIHEDKKAMLYHFYFHGYASRIADEKIESSTSMIVDLLLGGK